MAAYLVVEIEVKDPGKYERYKALAPPSIAQYGGRYLARGGKTETLEGACLWGGVEYDLTDPVLQRLARIVHAADIAQDIDSEPLARGLEAIATGFSLRYPEDERNLEIQFEVYDALYAWCRLQEGR